MITFSNDTTVAASECVRDWDTIPNNRSAAAVQYGPRAGFEPFCRRCCPDGDYGQRSASALDNALRDFGGALVGRESYARGNTSIVSAAQRLRAAGGYDTVLIADSARLGLEAADEIAAGGEPRAARILGTELWSGESVLARAASMEGATFRRGLRPALQALCR